MTESIFNKFWLKTVNYRAYKLNNSITHENIIQILSNQPYSVEFADNRNGWLIQDIQLWDSNSIACIPYKICHNKRVISAQIGSTYVEKEIIPIFFDFSRNLIFASTTSLNKLDRIIEKNAFKPIEQLYTYHSVTYRGEFLFWLTYIWEKKNGQISDEIKITDISIISSNYDEFNISEVIKTTTNVTAHIETKLILGLYGEASAIRIKIQKEDIKMDIALVPDGRVNLPKPDGQFDELHDKIVYSLMSYHIIQECYAQYLQFIIPSDDEEDIHNNWDDIKINYRVELLNDIKNNIDRFSESLQEQINETRD